MTNEEDADAGFFLELERAAKGLLIGSDVASAARLRRLLHEVKNEPRGPDRAFSLDGKAK